MNQINLLGIPVNTGSYSDFVQDIVQHAEEKISNYTCIANVHMLVEAYNDKDFAQIVKAANCITPDGKPLSWALRLLYGIRQDRVAGMDLLPDLLTAATIHKLPVYFYGTVETIMDATAIFLHKNYPGLIIAGTYSPPFRKLSEAEDQAIITKINTSGAKLLFVVLGCPKQEKWMGEMKGKINTLMVGIGGALSVLIGLQKRAPKWMQHAGLEWMFRLIQEPKRLFRRYVTTNTKFILILCKEYFLQKILHRDPSSF